MRKPFVAGNWKMNTDARTSVELAERVASSCRQTAGRSVAVAVMPPFVYLQAVVKALSRSHIAVGAQDVYFEEKGAFTGEISVSMLKDIGCTYALCGHSERRHVIGEMDELVNYDTGSRTDKRHSIACSGILIHWEVLRLYCQLGTMFSQYYAEKDGAQGYMYLAPRGSSCFHCIESEHAYYQLWSSYLETSTRPG